MQDKALNDPAAAIARHFPYGGKIKRIHVTEAQLPALNAGELGVLQLDGRYLLVTAAVLAEAFAEVLHRRVRTELWGYAPDEALDVDALIDESYRGIRPAPGYPACPEHSEKRTIFELLDATANAGIGLTESFAMTPAAAVSGLYFSHPGSRYFVVGRLSREQVADYARRKGVPLAQAERWLASNLDYDPA